MILLQNVFWPLRWILAIKFVLLLLKLLYKKKYIRVKLLPGQWIILWMKQKDCIFKTTAVEKGKWGITYFFVATAAAYKTMIFTRCTLFVFIDSIKVYLLWNHFAIGTPSKNFLHAQFTREETTMKIKEHKRLLFCRSLYSSLNFARGILRQK